MSLRSGPLLVTLLLCVLAPLTGVAQTEPSGGDPLSPSTPPPLVSAPEPPPPAPPQGELIPRQEPEPEETRLGTLPRVSLEFMGGAIGGALLGAPGAYLLMSDRHCENGSCTYAHGLSGGLLLVAGGSLGIAIGVKLAGDAVGGRGRFEVIYAFEAVALLGAAASDKSASDKASDVVIAASLFGLTAVMGTMGYEFSYDSPHSKQHKLTQGPWMLPVLGMSTQGTLTGGLAGTF